MEQHTSQEEIRRIIISDMVKKRGTIVPIIGDDTIVYKEKDSGEEIPFQEFILREFQKRYSHVELSDSDIVSMRGLTIVIAPFLSFAHLQQGFVKTIVRPDNPDAPLENVTIQMVGMVNDTTGSATGEFYLAAYNKKDGDAFKLLKVRKNGYELKDKELIGRSLVFSSYVPIYITMVDIRQLEADSDTGDRNLSQGGD